MSSKIAKTQRSKRALEAMAPKLVENVKKTLLLKGPKSSEVVQKVLRDLYTLKKPDAKLFTKRNLTRPFEDQSSLEYMCKANDSSLFAYGSHSKKRPQNLVLGRMFDFQVLDMIEFGLEASTFKSMADFEGKRKAVVRIGSKPMFVFRGSGFETSPELGTLKSLLLDYFRGEVLSKVNIAGLDRLIVCTAYKEKVYFRHYGVLLKNSGTSTPNVQLELVGPSMDLKIRRTRSAPVDLQKLAMQTPRGQRSSKRKNMEKGLHGDKMARVHLGRQNLDEIAVSKMKGLKKRKGEEGQAIEEMGNEGGVNEDDSD